MKVKKIPQRMCVACQQMKNKKELIRIVLSPDGVISVDVTGKKSGRGAYLCLNQECILKAQKAKNLDKVLKAAVPATIYQELLALVEGEDNATN